MKNTKKLLLAVAGLLIAVAGIGAAMLYWTNFRGIDPAIKPPPERIEDVINTTGMPLRLPGGFSISIFAKDLEKPRVLAYDSVGNLLVSIPSQGRVVALPDRNSDGVADETITVVDGLNRPHGLAMRCLETCELYIAESHQVAAYRYDENNLKALNQQKIVDLPDGGNHWSRTIMFMPAPNEDKLLISVGSSCNVCAEKDWRRAKILSANYDGTDFKTFASGLRNAVFMAIHPVTGKIWATEMGRDFLGDNLPPDEVVIAEEGRDYGWPYCYGKQILDPFGGDTSKSFCPTTVPSRIDIPAHSAPLGLAFIPEEARLPAPDGRRPDGGQGWPQEYWHNLLVAYHGSWNRSEPTGYKIVRYRLDDQGNLSAHSGLSPSGSKTGEGGEDFISGWLTEKNEALGRPVDMIVQPGGKMYISDDKAGVIYKVEYVGAKAVQDKSNLIRVSIPQPNDIVTSPLIIEGEARGYWFFEASFPVRLLDASDTIIAVHHAEALKEWMTEDFVPFRATLQFETPTTDTGTLVLEKDNPSGLPEYADELRIPVRFDVSDPGRASGGCMITGCSSHVCADREVITTCEYKEEYACYKTARCERQQDGACGWTMTPELLQCLQEASR